MVAIKVNNSKPIANLPHTLKHDLTVFYDKTNGHTLYMEYMNKRNFYLYRYKIITLSENEAESFIYNDFIGTERFTNYEHDTLFEHYVCVIGEDFEKVFNQLGRCHNKWSFNVTIDNLGMHTPKKLHLWFKDKTDAFKIKLLF